MTIVIPGELVIVFFVLIEIYLILTLVNAVLKYKIKKLDAIRKRGK